MVIVVLSSCAAQRFCETRPPGQRWLPRCVQRSEWEGGSKWESGWDRWTNKTWYSKKTYEEELAARRANKS
eukprot:32981-Amphidinium_carterae.2